MSLSIFSCVLAVVVLYNLGLLSFTEIQRELATLKVLGFDSKSLRRLLLTQNLWFSTIGFLLAIPGAYLLIGIMMGSTGDDYRFPINIYLWNFAVSFIITYGLYVLVNLAFSRKIKNVNMVESLILSMKTLTISADAFGIEEEETKFEIWLKEKFGKSLLDFVMVIAMILGVALGVGLFFFLSAFGICYIFIIA